MGRLREAMDALRAERRTGLVPYLCAGDPSLEWTEEAVLALAEAGAVAIELGVPFSDPVADGPTNERAAMRALQGGTTLSAILESVRRIRARGCSVPLLLFTYLNPALRMGLAEFARRAREAGVDGVLMVDLPVEEAGPWRQAAADHGLDTVFLVAPTTSDERLRAADHASTGFVYAVSRLGVTGARAALPDGLPEEISRLRSRLDAPVAVGFGLSTAEHAAALAGRADGVVVGSAIVRLFEEHPPEEAVRRAASLARSIVSALDGAKNPGEEQRC
jgi:tryptophan synthase alpha chain